MTVNTDLIPNFFQHFTSYRNRNEGKNKSKTSGIVERKNTVQIKISRFC